MLNDAVLEEYSGEKSVTDATSVIPSTVPVAKPAFKTGTIAAQCEKAIIVEARAQRESNEKESRTQLDSRIQHGSAAGAFIFKDIVFYDSRTRTTTPANSFSDGKLGAANTKIYHRYVPVDGYVDIGKMSEGKDIQIYAPSGAIPSFPVSPIDATLVDYSPGEVIVKPRGKSYPRTKPPPYGKTGVYFLQVEQDYSIAIRSALKLCPDWPKPITSSPVIPPLDSFAEMLMAKEEESTKRAFALAISQQELAGIQGPPGTGKTWLLANTAAWYLAKGKKIAIVSGSNKAVINALNAVYDRLDQLGIKQDIFKTGEEQQNLRDGIERFNPKKHKSPACLGATIHSAVTFHKEADITALNADMYFQDMKRDVILVDEAGQVPAFMTLALSYLAQSMIFFGDQNQLPPVIKGSHAVDNPTACSSMEFLENFRGKQWIVPLLTSHRMNKGICNTVQTLFYSNLSLVSGNNSGLKLVPATNSLITSNDITFYDIPHRNRSSRSREEIEFMEALVIEALQCKLSNGQQITPKDIAILTPYRCQSRGLVDCLSKYDIKQVGTVDKMQGQGAPIVMYSMTASSKEAIGNMAEWLFSPHRWNVAISRAMCKFIIVGNLKAVIESQPSKWQGLGRKSKVVLEFLTNPELCEKISF